jgi:hypothetical protein
VEKRGLGWTQRFNKGYVAYQRASGYNVVLITFSWSYTPRLEIKVPKPLVELGEKNPFPSLQIGWDQLHRQQWWLVPEVSSIGSVDPAVEITARYQPLTGPMPEAYTDVEFDGST